MSRYINLIEIIKETRPKTIMEIGTWNGIHAVQMIRTAQKFYSHYDSISYYGFDLFEDFKEGEKEFCPKAPAKIFDAETRIKATGCKFKLIKGNTKKTLANFKEIKTVDFVFIDGGHSLETIESDWINIQRLLTEKTVVVFDDYYPDDTTKGCKPLIDNLIHNNNWLIELLDPIDYFEHTNVTVQMVKVMSY